MTPSTTTKPRYAPYARYDEDAALRPIVRDAIATLQKGCAYAACARTKRGFATATYSSHAAYFCLIGALYKASDAVSSPFPSVPGRIETLARRHRILPPSRRDLAHFHDAQRKSPEVVTDTPPAPSIELLKKVLKVLPPPRG